MEELDDIVVSNGSEWGTVTTNELYLLQSSTYWYTDGGEKPSDGKKFVRQLREDGKGFETVEVDDLPNNTGGKSRNKKKAKAARKARKRNRR